MNIKINSSSSNEEEGKINFIIKSKIVALFVRHTFIIIKTEVLMLATALCVLPFSP